MSKWHDLTLGNVRWRVAAEWRDALFDHAELRLEEWRRAGRLETLKQATHRTIYRVNLSSRIVYLKHYPLNDLRARLRQLFRPSKARSEFEKALRLADRGVTTIEPLAFGETNQGESWLVTHGLDAEPLRQLIEITLPALPEGERLRLRFALAEHLARLLARMHAAGVLHRDLHAGNILVQREPLRLYLIDLHAVRLHDSLDWPARRDNLVMLNRWFVQRSSRSDRHRFWRHYVSQGRSLECGSRAAALSSSPADVAAPRGDNDQAGAALPHSKELERLTWESCLAFWRRRDRRWSTTNRYVYRCATGSNRGWAVRDLPPEVFARLLADPDAPFDSSQHKVLKTSRSSTVVELPVTLDGGVHQAIYKRFQTTRWTDPLLSAARATPAWKSWLNGHRLLECGLPTARPLAVIHRRKRGLVHDSYLLTEKLPNVVELRQHLAKMACLLANERSRRLLVLIESLARLVRELHRRQLSHRDLKAANVLVEDDAATRGRGDAEFGSRSPCPRVSASPRLFFIDLVGLKRWRKLPRWRKVQNLARLNASAGSFPWISRADKLRFLRAYLQWGLKGKSGWKTWWGQVAKKTAAKVRQNLSRGRPLS